MSDQFRPDDGAEVVTDVLERVETAAVVDRSVLEAVLAAVIARGHVLLEDVPGTGKTVTARVLAEALGLSFTRIQFTPDLLPSDVTGSNVYNEHDGTFEFSEGPVFTNVLLADEINRAPPKTQAALLEAMEERQVSADGTTHELPEPFFVIATQNPIEQSGTFRLPEAQRDRFSVKTSLGYPDVEGEMGLLDRRANRRSLAPSVGAVTDGESVQALQELAEDVTVEREVRRYIVDLARATRRDRRTETGVSPRGVQRVFEAARARAVIQGREFVTPEDVKRLAQPTMAHRLVLTTEATVDGAEGYDVVADALARVDVPGVAPENEDARSQAAEGEQRRAGGSADGSRSHTGDAGPGGRPRGGQQRGGTAGQRRDSPNRRQGASPNRRQQGDRQPRGAGHGPDERQRNQRGAGSGPRQQPRDGQLPEGQRRDQRPRDGHSPGSGEQRRGGGNRRNQRGPADEGGGSRNDAVDNRQNGPGGAEGPETDGHGRPESDGIDRVGSESEGGAGRREGDEAGREDT